MTTKWTLTLRYVVCEDDLGETLTHLFRVVGGEREPEPLCGRVDLSPQARRSDFDTCLRCDREAAIRGYSSKHLTEAMKS